MVSIQMMNFIAGHMTYIRSKTPKYDGYKHCIRSAKRAGKKRVHILEELLQNESDIRQHIEKLRSRNLKPKQKTKPKKQPIQARPEDYYKSKHWKDKRARILKRDGYKCKECSGTTYLQVHHVKYRQFSDKDKDCITLCLWCHKKRHKKMYVPDELMNWGIISNKGLDLTGLQL